MNDALREGPRCRVRAKWCCFAIFAIVSWVIFDVRASWLPALGAMPLAAAGALAMLLWISPLRIIAARRSAATPWSFDIVIVGVVFSAVIGAWLQDGALLIIGLLPAWIVLGQIALALYQVESRYPVKVYSRAHSLVFVEA